MKNFIKDTLINLRAMEPVGSEWYNKLSDAIQWIEEHTTEEKVEKKAEKSGYAHTTIRWKEDGIEEEAIIAVGQPFIAKHDDAILFYCENDAEFEHLKDHDNGEDFVVVGCTLFTKTLD